jgi:acyl-[acyl-carrier-protein]-phospholipid O-acyltransferase/long-chain-fatty-acid--[acyl-carrier-protein] ligase
MSKTLEQQEYTHCIRQARGKFAAMAATYFIGVFNDNFYKQCALFLALLVGYQQFQSYATVIFTLPFILFAAPAGYFADRFSKRNVVIAAKLMELAAMVVGAVGVLTLNWHLILIMIGIESTQAAIFSPALNGSIPELYPASYVIKANALIRMIATAAILTGIAFAGFVIAKSGLFHGLSYNRVLVAAVVIGVSFVGVIVSFGVPRFPAADPARSFPWSGPIDTIRTLYDLRHDSLLAVAVGANTFFWFAGSLIVLLVNQLGLDQYHLSTRVTSMLTVAELLGIAAGGFISTRLAAGPAWYRVLAPASLILGITMVAVAAVPLLPTVSIAVSVVNFSLSTMALLCILAVMGMAGGVYMIPLEAFIQVRPAVDRKGSIIAANNFACFTGILISGPVLYAFNYFTIAPTNAFAILAVLTFIVSAALKFTLTGGRHA